MSKAAFIAIACISLAPAAVLASGNVVERPAVPPAGEATLADCRTWVDHLDAVLEAAGPSFDQSLIAEAEDARERATQACDDGDYVRGIQTAADALDRLEGNE